MSCQRFDDKVEAVKRESEGQLAQAKENLARLTDEVELAITLLTTNQKDGADAEAVGRGCGPAQRVEPRAAARTLARAALKSQAAMATAQAYDAKALLLQSRLNYSQAHDEFIRAMGLTPE